eukprot:Rmarinus@m.2745
MFLTLLLVFGMRLVAFAEGCEADSVAGLIDFAMLSRECGDSFTGYLPKSCCDTLDVMAHHPCAAYLSDFYGGEDVVMAEWRFVRDLTASCGIVLGVGYNRTDVCGNGEVIGSEQCDDGNIVPGDGCTECFIDDRFSCFVPDEEAPSVCRECAEVCHKVNRNVCGEPYGECGDCVDGYSEDSEHRCAKWKYLYYVPVAAVGPRPYEHITDGCEYYPIGWVLEPDKLSTGIEYVGAVRAWRANRTDLAVSGQSCFVKFAIAEAKLPEMKEDVVFAFEVHSKYTEVSKTDIYDGYQAVLFSEGQQPVLNAAGMRAFEVFFKTRLFLYNVVVNGTRSAVGGVALSYGAVSMDTVVVTGAVEDQDVKPFTYQCTGVVLYSVGVLVMTNVVLTGNSVQALHRSENCMVYELDIISATQEILLSDVVFTDNYVADVLLHLKYSTPQSVFNNLVFERNTCGMSLVYVDVDAKFSNIIARNNTIIGSGKSMIQFSGLSMLSNFDISSNTVHSEVPVITVMGKSLLQQGTIAHTSSESSGSGAIANRGVLVAKDVLFLNNGLGAVRTSGNAYIVRCIFRDNTAAMHYTTIHNSNLLEVDSSEFYDTSEATEPTIFSTTPFVLRGSKLGEGTSVVGAADCASLVPAYQGGLKPPCGVQSLCTHNFDVSLNCECPAGYVGPPSTLCGPLATVYILPDEEVVSYVTKGPTGSHNETIGVISDGIGVVTWYIDEKTLPDWLNVTPKSGSFSSEDGCISDVVPLDVTFSTVGIRGNDTNRQVSVRVATYAWYSYENVTTGMKENVTKEDDDTWLDVVMSVEVPANATLSSVIHLSPNTACGSEGCTVEEGSEVTLRIDMRDVEGLSLGVGGTTFGLRVFSFAERHLASLTWGHTLFTTKDFSNGTYEMTFTALDEAFVAVVDLQGEIVSGKPLLYMVRCDSDRSFDSEGRYCVDNKPAVPKDVLIAAIVIMLLFCSGSFSYLYRHRRRWELMLQLVVSEVTTLTFSGVMELFDILSDTGTFVSVLLADEMSSYVVYYMVAFAVAFVSSAIYFWVLLLDMRRALGRRDYSVGFERASQCSDIMPSAVVVSGMGTFTRFTELREAITQLERKLRRIYASLFVTVCEDTPMLILGAIVMTDTAVKVPLPVIISLQISCLSFGGALTNVSAIKDTKEQIERVKKRLQDALNEVESATKGDVSVEPLVRGRISKMSESVIIRKQKEDTPKDVVASTVLQFCVIN